MTRIVFTPDRRSPATPEARRAPVPLVFTKAAPVPVARDVAFNGRVGAWTTSPDAFLPPEAVDALVLRDPPITKASGPGSRGGRGYFTDEGVWRYGERAGGGTHYEIYRAKQWVGSSKKLRWHWGEHEGQQPTGRTRGSFNSDDEAIADAKRDHDERAGGGDPPTTLKAKAPAGAEPKPGLFAGPRAAEGEVPVGKTKRGHPVFASGADVGKYDDDDHHDAGAAHARAHAYHAARADAHREMAEKDTEDWRRSETHHADADRHAKLAEHHGDLSRDHLVAGGHGLERTLDDATGTLGEPTPISPEERGEAATRLKERTHYGHPGGLTDQDRQTYGAWAEGKDAPDPAEPDAQPKREAFAAKVDRWKQKLRQIASGKRSAAPAGKDAKPEPARAKKPIVKAAAPDCQPLLVKATAIGRLASHAAALEKDLWYLDHEDLPPLEERVDAGAVMVKAQLVSARASMLGELAAINVALTKARVDVEAVRPEVGTHGFPTLGADVIPKVGKTASPPGITFTKARKLHRRRRLGGLAISVENQAGSHRHWTDAGTGERGTSKMPHDYGYIRRTMGLDGDQVDVFVGPNRHPDTVWVVTTMAKPAFTEVDEQKVMLGFDSLEQARTAFLTAYDDPRFLGQIDAMPFAEFKQHARATWEFPGLIRGEVVQRGPLALMKAVRDLPLGPSRKNPAVQRHQRPAYAKNRAEAFAAQARAQGLTPEMASIVANYDPGEDHVRAMTRHVPKCATCRRNVARVQRGEPPSEACAEANGIVGRWTAASGASMRKAPGPALGFGAAGKRPPVGTQGATRAPMGTKGSTAPPTADAVPSDKLGKHLASLVPALEHVLEALGEAFPGVPCAGRLAETASVADGVAKGEKPIAAEDLASVRLIVDTAADQAQALTRLKRVLPSVRSEKDALAHPEGSLRYRSIDCVVDVEGTPVEVQIRTLRQNAWADYARDALVAMNGRAMPPAVVVYLRAMSDAFAAKDGAPGVQAVGQPPELPEELGVVGELKDPIG